MGRLEELHGASDAERRGLAAAQDQLEEEAAQEEGSEHVRSQTDRDQWRPLLAWLEAGRLGGSAESPAKTSANF